VLPTSPAGVLAAPAAHEERCRKGSQPLGAG
jgi:hypothetical protein